MVSDKQVERIMKEHGRIWRGEVHNYACIVSFGIFEVLVKQRGMKRDLIVTCLYCFPMGRAKRTFFSHTYFLVWKKESWLCFFASEVWNSPQPKSKYRLSCCSYWILYSIECRMQSVRLQTNYWIWLLRFFILFSKTFVLKTSSFLTYKVPYFLESSRSFISQLLRHLQLLQTSAIS